VSAPAQPPDVAATERTIAGVLFVGTLVGVGSLAVGVALMLGAGISPTSDTWPPFEAGRVPGDVAAARAEGFLWAGIVILIATPIVQVIAELAAFVLRREWRMALVATAILAIIGLSVALATGTEA
jgi:uncharacterized membrane protein